MSAHEHKMVVKHEITPGLSWRYRCEFPDCNYETDSFGKPERVEAFEKDAEIARLQRRVEALDKLLSDLYELVEDGILVRNVTNDAHLPSYIAEATSLVATLKAVDAVLRGQETSDV